MFKEGGKADGVIGYFQNVTARKKAELALKETQRTIRGSATNCPIRQLGVEILLQVNCTGPKNCMRYTGVNPETFVPTMELSEGSCIPTTGNS